MYKYFEELEFICDIIKKGYAKYAGKSIETSEDKSKFDLVTSVDYGMEKFIISAIKQKYPNDVILSEEYNNCIEIKNRTWTIDPIDGTVNMANKIPIFGIQCALMEDGVPVLGVIYLPSLDELYTAVKGNGAYLNGNKIFVSKKSLDHCIVSFGDFPHSRKDEFEAEQKIMCNLSKSISKIRMFGSACVDFAFLAAGRTDGTLIFTKNKWDIVPGIVISQEAGAMIKSLNGDYSFDDNVVVATSDKYLYDEILKANT